MRLGPPCCHRPATVNFEYPFTLVLSGTSSLLLTFVEVHCSCEVRSYFLHVSPTTLSNVRRCRLPPPPTRARGRSLDELSQDNPTANLSTTLITNHFQRKSQAGIVPESKQPMKISPTLMRSHHQNTNCHHQFAKLGPRVQRSAKLARRPLR